MMNRQHLKALSLSCALSVTLFIMVLGVWTYQLHRQIQARLEQGWFLPPVEIYSAPKKISVGTRVSPNTIASQLKRFAYRERQVGQHLHPGDFAWWDATTCQAHTSTLLPPTTERCLILATQNHQLRAFGLNKENTVTLVLEGEPLEAQAYIELHPILFAQFYGNQPLLRRIIEVGQAPLACLQAVTAIEDSQFLEHRGVSLTGTLRAALRNLLQRRYAEGGSTITQQLVKNYFLSGEKTLRRKVTEQIMAVLIEAQFTKDEILQSYLNVIYMGQNGPFQVRGFGAAAEHYFDKNLEELNVAECALLAAVINSPGRFNPFTQPENALNRRQLVLHKMQELGMIDDNTLKIHQDHPLPQKPPRRLSEPAPYFVDAIQKKINELNIPRNEGLRVFTTLDIEAQEVAQNVISSSLPSLVNRHARIKKLQEEGHLLQASLISVDLDNNQVIALVGGRSYRQTQFNRIVDSYRQVGSVIKPLVYMSALESLDENGRPLTPLSLIDDSPFTLEYEGQSWSPRNYEGRFHGWVPLFVALKNSYNVATARLGTQLGLESIMDLARRTGVESRMLALPSLTLGAFEMRPWEVAQVYSTLARMGSFQKLSVVRHIEDLHGQVLYREPELVEQTIAAENVAVLVGMMKQTLLTGTARSSQALGFKVPAAGKTGTTSDTRDSWFAGFTPNILTVVWVGFDDNRSTGLTGASGALPLWLDYMKDYALQFGESDFDWPPGTIEYPLSPFELELIYPDMKVLPSSDTYLIFLEGEEPF